MSVLAGALSGCGLGAELEDAVFRRSCTAVGLNEGVSVDLTGVLPFEGEYRVTLSMPDLEESIPATLSGNTEGGLFIADSVDLDGDPVEVHGQDLDGLLLSVAKHRTVQRDGINVQGQRYLAPTLAPFVGHRVTIR